MSSNCILPLFRYSLLGHHIAGKVNVLQSVIVEITDAHTASIVHIDQVNGINGIVLNDPVIEINARIFRCYQLEKFVILFTRPTKQQGTSQKKYKNEFHVKVK
jgi:hypothetical protein